MKVENKKELAFSLSEEDQKIRKGWLILLIGESVIHLLLDILIPEPAFYKYGILPKLFSVLLGVGIDYMIYHFTYKRYGTGWLTYVIFVGPLYWLFCLWKMLDYSVDRMIALKLFIYLIIAIFYYYFSWKLKKIHRKIQHVQLMSSEDYVNALTALREAKTLDDLASKYYSAARELPEHLSDPLLTEYELLKKGLE